MVRATANRVVRKAVGHHPDPKWPGSVTYWIPGNRARGETAVVLHEMVPEPGWPGFPLEPGEGKWAPDLSHDYALEPTPGGPNWKTPPVPGQNPRDVVRIRRFLLEPPELGVVIGRRLRWEGIREPGTPGVVTAFGEQEAEEGYLILERSALLAVVALDPRGPGAPRIVMAVQSDLDPVFA